MITRYHTASGSVYEVEGTGLQEIGPWDGSPIAWGYHSLRARRVVRSDISRSERVAVEWRDCESAGCIGVGAPLVIWWGSGRDEHSANAEQIGTEEVVGTPAEAAIQRCTQTTLVKFIERVKEPS